jgi:hypothetical protein
MRDVKAIQIDGDLALRPLTEPGEIAHGSLKTSAETYAISTFARNFRLGHTPWVDDDLGAFADLAAQLGRHAAEFVAGKAATLLETNPNGSDGVAVFASGHANLGAAGALSETDVR